VADQCVGVEAGRVRRSLTRALLVLGGALIATVLGWLLSSATASAAELPSVPVVPSDVVSSVVPAVAVPAILPATPKLPATPPDLSQVAQQVHLAVAGDDHVVPSVLPVAVPVPSAPVSPVRATTVVTNSVQQIAVRQFVRPLSQYRHVAGGAQRSGQRTAKSVPVAPAHPLPPAQPVGSSDTSAHGSGGPTGGAGGAQLPFVQLPGAAPNSVGSPTSPRLSVAPGHQPGTSPD
jgi:hypothetical protein